MKKIKILGLAIMAFLFISGCSGKNETDDQSETSEIDLKNKFAEIGKMYLTTKLQESTAEIDKGKIVKSSTIKSIDSVSSAQVWLLNINMKNQESARLKKLNDLKFQEIQLRSEMRMYGTPAKGVLWDTDTSELANYRNDYMAYLITVDEVLADSSLVDTTDFLYYVVTYDVELLNNGVSVEEMEWPLFFNKEQYIVEPDELKYK